MRLIDADALIKQIKKNLCEPCKKRNGDYNGVRCRACQYGDEIDDIYDAPSVMEWIPCSEKLPEATDGEYLCSVLDFEKEPIVYCLRYCNSDDPDEAGWWYDGWFENRCDQKDITAWMPLPEPYKE